MKKLFFSILILQIFILNGQKITKEDFNEMLKTSGLIVSYIEKTESKNLQLYLKLNPDDSQKLKTVLENNYIQNSVFALPHFLVTDEPNKFQMIIAGYEVLPKIKNEKYERGKYYFVIKSIVTIYPEKKEVSYGNSQVLIKQNEINKWWLSQYKTYFSDTMKIMNKYGYKPPPPPCPPKSL
jgi:hypothetical protein